MTSLQNDLEILSPGVRLRVRKDYHPHNVHSKTVPNRHILSSNLMSMLSSIYFNQMYVHNLLRISELFDQQSSSVRNGFKVTLI